MKRIKAKLVRESIGSIGSDGSSLISLLNEIDADWSNGIPRGDENDSMYYMLSNAGDLIERAAEVLGCPEDRMYNVCSDNNSVYPVTATEVLSLLTTGNVSDLLDWVGPAKNRSVIERMISGLDTTFVKVPVRIKRGWSMLHYPGLSLVVVKYDVNLDDSMDACYMFC